MRVAARIVLLLCAGPLVLAAPHVFAALPSPVKVETTLPSAALAPGALSEIAIKATLDAGWHIYSLTQPAGGPVATTVKLDTGNILEVAGPVRQGTFEKHLEPAFGVDVESFSGTAGFWLPVRVVATAKPGTYTCAVRVRGQACDGRICLPPTDYVAQVKLVVAKKSAAKPAEKPASAQAAKEPKEAAKPAPKPAGMDLRALYEAILLARPDRAAYGKLAALVPDLLGHTTFTGDEAYFAGMLWLVYDMHADKDDDTLEMTQVANNLEAYLGSADPSKYAEPAGANLIAAEASLKRFEDAIKRFEEFSKHYRWRSEPHDLRTFMTNFEYADASLVRALG